MSTDTPVQKDEPNASAEQQSAPVQPVSEEPVAPVTETAATDTDAQPSPAPETETVTPPPAEPAPAKPSPVQEEKAAPAPKAAKVSRSPAPEAQPQTSSFASRCFNGLASVGPLVLILFWLIQSMPTFMDGSCTRCIIWASACSASPRPACPPPSFIRSTTGS